MRVTELWRFPVKSFQGERLDTVTMTDTGIIGDRAAALLDLDTGYFLTARRAPDLLCASARFAGTGARPEITLPDGTLDPDDATLSRWLGRRVELRVVDDSKAPRTYENPMDVAGEADWVTFDGPSGPFHDSVRTRVSLVSTTTLGEWDRRRFRANVVLGGDGEDALVGTEVALGDARLDVTKRIGRCVIVTRPQPGSIERDLDVLRTVNRDRDGCVGIGALVARPGIVHVGDALTRLP